ncbi:hypothetical protein HD806DRAFT_527633 [Xylariaceae sp. AK1471]|nr:hypothetical protein HD806DRAFT_527633 [Xylariaceae sp. AK1471]
MLFGSLFFEDDGSTAISSLHKIGATMRALGDLERAAGLLQQMGGCCDSFSCLWLEGSCVELIRVGLEVLSNETTQLQTLAAQFLSLAFLSYSQAHCGPIRPFFLDTPLTRILLVGDQEWTADFHGPCIVETRLDLDLLASPEDVLDTWGPGGFTIPKDDPENIYAISIGGGLVTLTTTDPSTLHWRLAMRLDPLPVVTFHRRKKVRIGANVSSNDKCQAEPQRQL